MTNILKIKRSAVQGKAPQTTDIILGELAINTHDGKLFLKKNDGAESIVDVTDRVKGSGDTLTAGYAYQAPDDGTQSSGTYTPAQSTGNMRKITNGGAFTFAAPTDSDDFTMVVKVTNGASAGAITMSGFDKVSGDSFTTTSGDVFFVNITKLGGTIRANVEAMQ